MAKKRNTSKKKISTSAVAVKKAMSNMTGLEKQAMLAKQSALNRKERREMARAESKLKASSANIQKTRDEFFKTNTAWKDLKDLYTKHAQLIANTLSQLISLYKTPALIDFLEKDEFKENKILFTSVQKDIEVMSDRLVSIYNKHKDKPTEGVSTEEEFNESLLIFEEYKDFADKFNAIVMPTYQTLVEKAGIALGKVKLASDAVIASKAQDSSSNAPIDVPYVDIK